MTRSCFLTALLIVSAGLASCQKKAPPREATANDPAPRPIVKASTPKEPPPVVAPPKVPEKLPEGEQPSVEERQMLDLINAARAKENAPPLKWNAKLASVARAHAVEMGVKGQMVPQFGNKDLGQHLREAAYPFSNYAQAAGAASDGKAMCQEWLASAQVRPMLMNPRCDEVGLGVGRPPMKNLAYFSQIIASQQKPVPNAN